MKKYLLILLMFSCGMPMVAEMMYDPVLNRFFSYPESSEINQFEYRGLFMGCINLIERIKRFNDYRWPSKELAFSQIDDFLQRVGSPTALRLSADIKKNVILYGNGDFMRDFYSQSIGI